MLKYWLRNMWTTPYCRNNGNDIRWRIRHQQKIPILSQSQIEAVKCVLQALQLVAKSISSRPGGKKGLSCRNPTIEARPSDKCTMVKIATPNMPLFPFVLGQYQIYKNRRQENLYQLMSLITLFIGNKVNLFVNTSKVNVMDEDFALRSLN